MIQKAAGKQIDSRSNASIASKGRGRPATGNKSPKKAKQQVLDQDPEGKLIISAVKPELETLWEDYAVKKRAAKMAAKAYKKHRSACKWLKSPESSEQEE